MGLLSSCLLNQGFFITIRTMHKVLNDPIVVVDVICTIVSFILGMVLCSVNDFQLLLSYEFTSVLFKAYCLFTIAKIISVIKFLRRIREMKLILDVMVKSSLFLLDLFGMMGIVMLLFSSIGISLFGGVINSSNIPNFEDITGEPFDDGLEFFNFNDYMNALVCLYSIILAGWQDFLRMTCFAYPKRSFLHNYYFVLFFLVANMFLLNILIGFIIDNIVEYLCDDINEAENENNLKVGENGNNVVGGVLGFYQRGKQNADIVKNLGNALINKISGE